MTQAALDVKPPGAAVYRVPLDPVPFRIGRSPDSHLVLRDSRASRNHAIIHIEGRDYSIEDCGSRNGIEINGIREQKRILRQGDVVRFGVEDSYELTFVAGQSPAPAPGTGQTGLRKLRSMLEVARSIQGALSLDHVLTSVVDAALEITNCQRGFLLLYTNGALETRIAREAGGRPLSGELDVPCTLLNNALKSRSDLLSMRFDPAADGLDASVAGLALRRVVCVPLIKVRAGDLAETSVVGTIADSIGLLYLDSRLEYGDLTTSSRDLVQSLAIEASFVLENARLLDEERAKQKMEQELRIARTIQQDLLPAEADYPRSGWLRAAGFSIPSKQVGGDYFDILPAGPDRYDVVMADVSGKGVSSALLAGVLQGAFVMGTAEQIPPSVMLERINRFLLARTDGMKYATIFLASIHRSAPMQWANAGHCAPLLLRPDGAIYELPPTGMPVGMLEEGSWRDDAVELQPEDTLILYTDGVSEAINIGGEFFGVDRLKEAISRHRGLPVAELVDAIRAELSAFKGSAGQRDDQTLFVLQIAGL